MRKFFAIAGALLAVTATASPAQAALVGFAGVPEPGAIALFGLGLLGLAARRRRA